jgi:uncharacterized membrane protein YhaH (DUF805 family)
MTKILFSFEGRINRKIAWYYSIFVYFFIVVPPFLLKLFFNLQVEKEWHGVMWLLFLWPALAVQVKRWHDLDRSGWWVLINFIPIIGPIWALVETGFFRGTVGENRFGADPLGADPTGDDPLRENP